MTDEERDRLIVEMHTDIQWLKDNWKNLNSYKLLVWGALITALIGLVV